MTRQYIITVLDCSKGEIFTAEYDMPVNHLTIARTYFMNKLNTDCPYHRYMILSIYDKENVIAQYKEGQPLPKEVQTFFEGENPDCPENREDRYFLGLLGNADADRDRLSIFDKDSDDIQNDYTPCDSDGKQYGHENDDDEDCDDGDEWKRLLR